MKLKKDNVRKKELTKEDIDLLLEYSVQCGCDRDGDTFIKNGVAYFVHYNDGIIFPLKKEI